MALKTNYKLIVLYFYILTYAIESPIRYALYRIDVPWLIYTRDFFIGVVCLLFLYNVFIKKDINKYFFYFIIFFGIACLVGFINIENPLQVLFGCKMFLPFFFGVIVSKSFFYNLNNMKGFYLALFFISCIGIVFNYFYQDLPWIGVQYDLGSQAIELQRDWSTQGFSRLSGFARVSFSASNMILYSAIWIFVFKKNFILMGIVGIICTILTTTKGTIVAFLVCFFLAFFQSIKNIDKVMWFFLVCIFSIMIFLPIMSASSDHFYVDYQNMEMGILIFASFNDRLLNVWPNVFEIIEKNGDLFWGRGIGGIGAAQKFFDLDVPYNPADNFFLLLYAFFGVLSIPFLLYILEYARKLNFISLNDRFSMLSLIAIFAGGIVGSVLDFGVTALYLGLLVGNSFFRSIHTNKE